MRALRSSHRLVAILAIGVVACSKESTPKAPPAPPAGPSAPPAAPLNPAPPAAPAGPTGSAEYTVIIKSTWTKTTHPYEYPSDAHFSGMIGASHNAKYSIFGVGHRPTPGLERLSEEGKHSPLDNEIKAAIGQGNALMEFESGGLKNWKDSMVATVRVDPAHPLVSVVNMVAPSPDWFTGVAGVSLAEHGVWVEHRTYSLLAYDSGGDDGTTYKAPDKNTNPKKPTARAATRHFVIHGDVRPVGTVTFVRKGS